MDAGERDGSQGRARVASHAPREPGPQRDRVERKPPDRVHERQAVGARRDHRARRLGDVPLRRREFREERLGRRAARRGDELGCRLGRLLDVRAREVQLDRGDPVVPVETGAAERVVVGRKAADRDPERHPELGEAWQAVLAERVDPGPLEADRVHHPVLGLRDPDRWVAGARERRDRLRHDDVERARHTGGRQRVETPGRVEKRNRHAAPASRTGPSTQSRT